MTNDLLKIMQELDVNDEEHKTLVYAKKELESLKELKVDLTFKEIDKIRFRVALFLAIADKLNKKVGFKEIVTSLKIPDRYHQTLRRYLKGSIFTNAGEKLSHKVDKRLFPPVGRPSHLYKMNTDIIQLINRKNNPNISEYSKNFFRKTVIFFKKTNAEEDFKPFLEKFSSSEEKIIRFYNEFYKEVIIPVEKVIKKWRITHNTDSIS